MSQPNLAKPPSPLQLRDKLEEYVLKELLGPGSVEEELIGRIYETIDHFQHVAKMVGKICIVPHPKERNSLGEKTCDV